MPRTLFSCGIAFAKCRCGAHLPCASLVRTDGLLVVLGTHSAGNPLPLGEIPHPRVGVTRHGGSQEFRCLFSWGCVAGEFVGHPGGLPLACCGNPNSITGNSVKSAGPCPMGQASRALYGYGKNANGVGIQGVGKLLALTLFPVVCCCVLLGPTAQYCQPLGADPRCALPKPVPICNVANPLGAIRAG